VLHAIIVEGPKSFLIIDPQYRCHRFGLQSRRKRSAQPYNAPKISKVD
jgi:hypothetical protein